MLVVSFIRTLSILKIVTHSPCSYPPTLATYNASYGKKTTRILRQMSHKMTESYCHVFIRAWHYNSSIIHTARILLCLVTNWYLPCKHKTLQTRNYYVQLTFWRNTYVFIMLSVCWVSTVCLLFRGNSLLLRRSYDCTIVLTSLSEATLRNMGTCMELIHTNW